MPSTKKLTTYRKSQFNAPRRKKPLVRALNREIKERVKCEHDLVQALVRDADTRRAVLIGLQRRIEPFSVWNDFDHTTGALTEVVPSDLPRWREVGEYLKLHLLFQVALDGGGFSFTVRVRPDLEAKWTAEGRDPMDRINRETHKAIVANGLRGLEYLQNAKTRVRSSNAKQMK